MGLLRLCRGCVGGEFGLVGLNFFDGGEDLVHAVAGVEGYAGGEGDHFLGAGALGVGAADGGVVDVGGAVGARPDAAEFAVDVREQIGAVHGAVVFGLARDALGVEGPDEEVAGEAAEGPGVVAQDEQVVGGAGGKGVLAAGDDAVDVLEEGSEVAAVGVAPVGLLVEPLELREAEDGVDGVEAAVAGGVGEEFLGGGASLAGAGEFAAALAAGVVEFAVAAGAFVDEGIVGDQDAAAAGGKVFAAAATEAAGVADGAEAAMVPGSAVGVGDVLDDGEVVALADVEDGLHVAADAAEVDGHDGGGAGGDGGLDGRRRDVVGVGVDVGKGGDEAGVEDGGDAGEKGDGRDDDLGAAVEAEGL